MTAYLIQCQKLISESLENLKKNPADRSGHVIDLPALDSIEYAGYRAQLERLVVPTVNTAHLCSLLELSQNRLRLIATQQQDGVIWHEVSIPSDLRDVIVLDASYHIRKLVHFDESISVGWSFHDYDVKRYDNVTIHQLLTSGSRSAITESFKRNERQDRHISREIVEVVKSHAASSGILIFTFKKREVDIEKRLLDDLKAAGIDTGETLANGRKRINVLTWGSETSLNDFAHCDVVIMAGVMQRSHLDIASMIVGQQDDLTAQVSSTRTLASVTSLTKS